jgi:hypothetical protein
MRVTASALLLLLLAGSSLAAQEESRWRRVHTYEDAFIEMEVIRLSVGDHGRVRFRTVFDETGPMGRLWGTKYKSSIEEIEFQCSEGAYRVTEVVLLDAKSKVIRVVEAGSSAGWKTAGPGSVMGRLSAAACRMIVEKRL